MSYIVIDGRQLEYKGTGLCHVTDEIIRALEKNTKNDGIHVLVPNKNFADHYKYEKAVIHRINYKKIKTDYLDRLSWSISVQKNTCNLNLKHIFIPYLYNYGCWSNNFVLIPDLVYRIYPDYGFRKKEQNFWNFKGRLPFRPLVRKIEEISASKAKKIIVYSDFVKNHVQEILKVKKDKIVKIPLAAPTWLTNELRDMPTKKFPFRYILYCGGYANRKNVSFLLKVCGYVKSKCKDFKCVFVGLNEHLLNDDLAELLQNAKISDAVIGTDKIDNKTLASFYQHCDYVVYPSKCEGFGLPILEASAASKLCICGDNSSMIEIQPNAQYRSSADDCSEWTDKMVYYWNNLDCANKAGIECHENGKRFSWDTAAAVVSNLFML